MASLFWVGGTGTFDGSTNHFATTSGGSATVAAVTSSDDVTIDSASGSGTMTIGAAFSCNTLTINSSTLTVACDGTHGITAVGAVTLTLGTLNTNGQTCSWGSLSSSNSNVRTLTLGASAVTLTGTGTALNVGTTTNLTWTTNTAIITMNGAGGGTNGALTFGAANKTSFVLSGSGTQSFGGGTCQDFTRTGTAVKGDALSVSTLTVQGVLTLNGNSVTNRLLVQSTAGAGTARAITANGTISSSNADFMDITGTGSASWDLSAITGGSGDCLGNTGITFTTAAPQTWQTTGAGSWSDVTKWTSRVPLPQDNVSFASAWSGTPTITADMPRLGKNIDWTGSTNAVTWSYSIAVTSYGDLVLVSGVGSSGSNQITLGGRGTQVITNPVALPSIAITAPGGTYTVSASWTSSNTSRVLTLIAGTLNPNGFNITCGSFVGTGTITRALNLGASTVTLTGTGAVWNIASTGMTFTPGTSTILITDTSATAKTFAGGSMTYNIVRHTATGSAGLTISGSTNVFAQLDLECSTARTITFGASGVTTVGVLTLQGASGQTLSLVSGTPSTSTTINVTRAYTKNFDSESADIILNLPIMGGGGGTGPGLRLVRKGF